MNRAFEQTAEGVLDTRAASRNVRNLEKDVSSHRGTHQLSLLSISIV